MIEACAFTGTVFLRRYFGERYLRWHSGFAGLIPMAVFTMGADVVNALYRTSTTYRLRGKFTMAAYAIAFLIAWAIHFSQNLKRSLKREKGTWQMIASYNPGHSRRWWYKLRIPGIGTFINVYYVQRFGEAILCVFIGLILARPLHDWFGYYLVAVGLCVYVSATGDHKLHRHMLLQKLDERVQVPINREIGEQTDFMSE